MYFNTVISPGVPSVINSSSRITGESTPVLVLILRADGRPGTEIEYAFSAFLVVVSSSRSLHEIPVFLIRCFVAHTARVVAGMLYKVRALTILGYMTA
jgi:hypothetical protein